MTTEVHVEGRSLTEALENAAKQLDIAPSMVQHRFDVEHFRSSTGLSRGVDTVKIFAWARDPEAFAGAEAARAWVEGLIANMKIEGAVTVRSKDSKKASVIINSAAGRHLVGRGGVTLHAIQHLLESAMSEEHGDWSYRLDVVGGDRDRRDRDGDRRGGRDDDRRGGRDRDRRGGRDRDRRGGRDGDRRQRNDQDVKALTKLAVKLANRVKDDGESIEIRQSLNSYERRIVHMAIADLSGVKTESFSDGDDKRIRILVDRSSEE